MMNRGNYVLRGAPWPNVGSIIIPQAGVLAAMRPKHVAHQAALRGTGLRSRTSG